MKKLFFKKTAFFLGMCSCLALSACTSTANNISSGNEWSLPSKKPGLALFPLTLIQKWANNGYDLSKMFNLTLKQSSETKKKLALEINLAMNNTTSKTDTNYATKSFNEKTVTNSYDTYEKASLLTKWFNNTNQQFPYWLVYDFQAKSENNKLKLIITVFDTSKNSSDAKYKMELSKNFS